MSKRKVVVECVHSFLTHTEIEIDEDDVIEDVHVKWEDMRVVTESGKEIKATIEELRHEDLDFKRPSEVKVWAEVFDKGTLIYGDCL